MKKRITAMLLMMLVILFPFMGMREIQAASIYLPKIELDKKTITLYIDPPFAGTGPNGIESWIKNLHPVDNYPQIRISEKWTDGVGNEFSGIFVNGKDYCYEATIISMAGVSSAPDIRGYTINVLNPFAHTPIKWNNGFPTISSSQTGKNYEVVYTARFTAKEAPSKDKGSYTFDLRSGKTFFDMSDETMQNSFEYLMDVVYFDDKSDLYDYTLDIDRDGTKDVGVNCTGGSGYEMIRLSSSSIKTKTAVVMQEAYRKDLNSIECDYYSTLVFRFADDPPTSTPVSSPRPANEASPENPKDLKALETVVLGSGGEKDTAASSFSLLQAKGIAKKKKVTLKWKPVPGAKGYVVYGNKCGKANKYVRLTPLPVTGTSWTQGGLRKGTYYKYIVAAVNGDKAVALSRTIHAATKGGKFGNAKKVKLNKKKVTLRLNKKKKKTFKATAAVTNTTGKVKNHRKVAWESSDIRIATVGKKGKITAVGKGTCFVYAYAQNGVMARIKVVVK